MYNYDVIIIGAGPAGSVAAKEIATKGYTVLLIEKDSYPGKTKVCAGNMHQMYAKRLNLSNEVIEKKINKEIYHYPLGSYANSVSRINVLRSVFDNVLAQKAVEEGANLSTSSLAYDVSCNKDGVLINIKNIKTGETYDVKGKLALFSDGVNTLVSKKIKGVGFEIMKKKAISAMYDLEWKNNHFIYNEFFFDKSIIDQGYIWIFPKKNLINVGIYCKKPSRKYRIKNYLDYIMKNHPLFSKKLYSRKKIRFAAWSIPLEHARRIYNDRLLVVGDAAGMVDPLWGAGIRYAIESGILASKISVKALEENLFDGFFLSQFEREWKKTEEYERLRRLHMLSQLIDFFPIYDKNVYNIIIFLLALRGGASKLEGGLGQSPLPQIKIIEDM